MRCPDEGQWNDDVSCIGPPTVCPVQFPYRVSDTRPPSRFRYHCLTVCSVPNHHPVSNHTDPNQTQSTRENVQICPLTAAASQAEARQVLIACVEPEAEADESVFLGACPERGS